jgi:hypothetical protein
MIVYTVTLWSPEDGEQYLAADGKLTACEACATRFIDPVTAEAAATRALRDGWGFAIEDMEI